MSLNRLIIKKRRAKQDGNLQQLSDVTKQIGDIYFETGEMSNALEEYMEQLETCNILNDKLNSAVAHRMIGEVYVNLGNYEEALLHQNRYLKGAKEIKNLLEEQRAFATLGRTYFCLAESLEEEVEKKNNALEDARKAYLESIHLCDRLESADVEMGEKITMRARVFLNLGLVLDAEKEHRQAIDLIIKAAVLCKEYNLRTDFYRTQIALGEIYERQKNYQLSLEHFEAAGQIEDASLKAEALFYKAETLLKMERWTESRQILVSLYVNKELSEIVKSRVRKTLRIVAVLQTTEQALNEEDSLDKKLKHYELLGDAAVAIYCHEKAIEYYKGMLSCAEELKTDSIGLALTSLAQTFKDIERYEEAICYARKELQLCTDPQEVCRSALFLADLLITINASDEEILEIYNLAWNNANTCNDTCLKTCIMKDQLNYLKKTNKIKEANALEKKLKALEESSLGIDSENEPENTDIGENICLDDLSDVKQKLEAMESVKLSLRRYRKRPFPIRKNLKGETPLHVACINGDITAVKRLLSVGHSVHVKDHYGWSPLHEAANHGHVEIVQLLLDHGADVNDPGNNKCHGLTPLHDAATCGHFSVMELLMESGADVTLKTLEGETALDCLVEWRDRVLELPAPDQAEFDEICNKLSMALPPSTKRRAIQQPSSLLAISDKAYADECAERISAAEDYRRTIANLKPRSDLIEMTAHKSDTPYVSPFLDSEVDFVDDWLEDDIGSNSKNRSCRNNCNGVTKRKSSDTYSNNEKSKKRQKIEATDDITISAEEYNLAREDRLDDPSEVINPINGHKASQKKKQVSLFSSGFTKEARTPSPTYVHEFISEVPHHLVQVNIFVEENLFYIEMNLSNKRKTFMEEVLNDLQNKFYHETGCEAKLNLTTMNGITIQSDSIEEILMKQESVKNLKCEIMDIKVPSIVDRYGTICRSCNTDIRDCVLKYLKSCENTSVLRLKKEDINKLEFMLVLKALKYQKNLQILHMSGGQIHGRGNILSGCISRLSSLQELCLHECNIDFECLSKLDQLPAQLKLLDLSYNPLRSSGQELVCKLVTPLKHLRTLNLRYCQLDSFQFPFNNNTLVNLDISWNNLDEKGLVCILQKQMLNLNLSNMTSSNQSILVRSFLNNSNVLLGNVESLELACCGLSDVDIENILSSVSNLTRLVITGNKNITVKSSNELLKHRPALKYIDVSGCKNITEYPDPALFLENPETCNFIANIIPEVSKFWLDLWRGKAIMTQLQHNLIIIKPSQTMKD